MVASIEPDTLAKLRPLTEELAKFVTLSSTTRADVLQGEAEVERLQQEKSWEALSQRATFLAALEREEGDLRQKIVELLDQAKAVVYPHAISPEEPSVVVSGSDTTETLTSAANPLPGAATKAPHDNKSGNAAADPVTSEAMSCGYSVPEPEKVEFDTSSDPSPIAPPDTPPVVDENSQLDPLANDLEEASPNKIIGIETAVLSPISEVETLELYDTIHSTIARYLNMGEVVLAWNLALLAEKSKFKPGLPPESLHALAAAPCVIGAYDRSSILLGEILAAAVAALKRCERSGDVAEAERARALTFAALLRPALLAVDTSAREHLENLSMGDLSDFIPLQKALAGLGHDFQPMLEDLRELAGVERERRTPAASASLHAWITQARRSQSVHQPTTDIFHRLIAPNGVLGEAVEAAISNRSGAEEAAQALLDSYLGNRDAMARLVAEVEREINRPKRDRIRGMALDWICRKLQDGCEHIQTWTHASVSDRRQLDNRRKQVLRSNVGSLRKVLELVAGRGGEHQNVGA